MVDGVGASPAKLALPSALTCTSRPPHHLQVGAAWHWPLGTLIQGAQDHTPGGQVDACATMGGGG